MFLIGWVRSIIPLLPFPIETVPILASTFTISCLQLYPHQFSSLPVTYWLVISTQPLNFLDIGWVMVLKMISDCFSQIEFAPNSLDRKKQS